MTAQGKSCFCQNIALNVLELVVLVWRCALKPKLSHQYLFIFLLTAKVERLSQCFGIYFRRYRAVASKRRLELPDFGSTNISSFGK